MSEKYTFSPFKAALQEKVFGISTGQPKELTLFFNDKKLSIMIGHRIVDNFYLKKFAINRRPTDREYHLRTDGFAISFCPADHFFIDVFEERLKSINQGSAASVVSTKITNPRLPSKPFISNQRFSSPSIRSTVDLQPKTSGIISRTKADAVQGRLQSPPRSISAVEKRVYTQSPLKSPLKTIPRSDETQADNLQRNSLSDFLPPTTSIPSVHAVDPVKTYGRKRPISSVNGSIPSSYEIARQMNPLSQDSDIFDGIMTETPKGYAATTDTKAIIPKKLELLLNPNAPQSSMTRTSTPLKERNSSSLWNTFSSKLNPSSSMPSTVSPVQGNLKQARMRVDSSPPRSTYVHDQDNVRTPELPVKSLVTPRLYPTVVPLNESSSFPSNLFSAPSKPFHGRNNQVTTFDSKYEGGIRNLGNTCYMSAILQALSSVRGLSANMHSPLWNAVYTHLIHSNTNGTSAVEAAKENEINLFSPSATAPLLTQKPAIVPEKSLFLQLSNVLRLLETKRNVHIDQKELQSLLGTNVAATGSMFDSSINSKIDSLLKVERKYCVDPMRFRAVVIGQQVKYGNYSQQDSQEFLTDLMNDLEEDMMKAVRLYWIHHKLSGYITSRKKEISSLPITTPSPASISTVPRTIMVPESADTEDVNILQHQDPPMQEDHPDSTAKPVVVDQETELNITREVDAQLLQLKPLLPSSLFFESTLQNVMTCTCCGFQHEPRTEPYRDFSLDIFPEEEGDASRGIAASPRQMQLHSLIQRYLQPESLDLRCSHCEEGAQVSMQKKVTSLAPVLVFHLKRFQYDRKLQQFRKVDANVQFPQRLSLRAAGIIDSSVKTQWSTLEAKAQVINSANFKRIFESKVDGNSGQVLEEKLQSCGQLSKEIAEGKVAKGMMAYTRQEDSEYQLVAVVRHYGVSIGVGHYICDVRNHKVTSVGQQGQENEPASKWLRYNDSIVTPITEDAVLGEMDTPYLLFYQKV